MASELDYLNINSLTQAELAGLQIPVCASGVESLVDFNFLISFLSPDLIPCGTVIDCISTVVPPTDVNGNSIWLEANGQTFDALIYTDLAEKLGGNILPNYTGRTSLGAALDEVGQTFSDLTVMGDGRAATDNATVNLEVQHLPSHTHTYEDEYVNNVRGADDAKSATDAASVSAIRTRNAVSGPSGTGADIDISQPYFITKKLIKAL